MNLKLKIPLLALSSFLLLTGCNAAIREAEDVGIEYSTPRHTVEVNEGLPQEEEVDDTEIQEEREEVPEEEVVPESTDPIEDEEDGFVEADFLQEGESLADPIGDVSNEGNEVEVTHDPSLGCDQLTGELRANCLDYFENTSFYDGSAPGSPPIPVTP